MIKTTKAVILLLYCYNELSQDEQFKWLVFRDRLSIMLNLV